jgi:hypothetical protein
VRSHKYEEGRRKALEKLGLTKRPKDNYLIENFISKVDGDAARRGDGPKVNRLDRSPSWGPKFTIPAEDVGVGA